ncbi:RidA family protein [Actibacterium sp. 188UL27-1]|uniref:RidA family protein n=1 Tax=Actibacterium sp. 188UL27-1 TaxID=2786961 RepID=UPI001959D2FC|nr:RidA family protein [Actibacterium sp. 188UL27-1]MBM7069208.1 RidA family protein [Actibacterium sp. 188UL27-1]
MSTAIQRLNPPALPDAGKIGYSQISIADPARIAFVSGQVAWPVDGSATPANLADQTTLMIAHLRSALASLNAQPSDILNLRLYLTEITEEGQQQVMGQLLSFLDGARPSLTGIGVKALAAPDLKIEVEMVVQVPA